MRDIAKEGMSEDQTDIFSDEIPGLTEPYLVTLDTVEGERLECEVLASFTDGEKIYMALIPSDGGGTGIVYLFSVTEGVDDAVELANIEDDAEYERAASLFDEIFSGEDEEWK